MPWLCVGDLMLQPNGGRLVIVPKPLNGSQDREVTLTPLQTELLWYLMARAGQVISWRELGDGVWGKWSTKNVETSIRIYVQRLREKIELDPQRPVYIRTMLRHGYIVPFPGQDWPRRKVANSNLWS